MDAGQLNHLTLKMAVYLRDWHGKYRRDAVILATHDEFFSCLIQAVALCEQHIRTKTQLPRQRRPKWTEERREAILLKNLTKKEKK